MIAFNPLGRWVAWGLPLGLLLALACRKDMPSAPPASPTAAAPLQVNKDGAWLFTYATPEGRFESADNADEIPAVSQGVVRAQNPENKKANETTGTDVWVVNVADVLTRGSSEAKRVPRVLFETQALALLPPGQSSILADRPADHDAGAEDLPAASAGGAARVVLYGTSWCGACRTARQYFLSHNIPFVDKDVEKDPAAADELQKRAAQLGVPADRVPILDVQGRLLIGFDPRRVQALLGETI